MRLTITRSCNDFRAAQQNTYRSSLTNSCGQGIEVVSDGSQTTRATLGVHQVFLKVLDSYRGSESPGKWSTVGFHYGPGKLVRRGDVLDGAVKMRLVPG